MRTALGMPGSFTAFDLLSGAFLFLRWLEWLESRKNFEQPDEPLKQLFLLHHGGTSETRRYTQ